MKTLDGEEVPEKVVEEIKYRIRQLSREQIDELFYGTGFIVSNAKDDGNKALTDKQIDWIKSGDDAMIDNLIRDGNKETVEKVIDLLKYPEEDDFSRK
ncbi:MAG: hypothetical protein ABEJ99_03310 [Candidatus Nanohaloarchaea archaeon]